MSSNPYRYEPPTPAATNGMLKPFVVQFRGPGLSYHYSDVAVLDPSEDGTYSGDKISVMLAQAYEAGRDSMAKDLRRLLGVVGVGPFAR